VAVADFNGDGKLDIAVGNFDNSNPSISILLGNGDGTFQPAVNYNVPCCPSSIMAGDFNGDGKLDLVAATDAASVLLGNGDGTFQPVLNYPAGSNTATAAVGDFNGDGHLDLAVANNGGNNVSVLLGNGDGTFQSAPEYPVGNAPLTVVAGDFNGDGILDLAVTNLSDNTVSVLLGNGNGTFQSAVNYSAAGYPWGMTVGDLNGDGNLDLAVATGPTQILFGKGDGTFEPAAAYGGELANPNSIAAGDFTGQGRPDLVRTDGVSAAELLVQSLLAPSATSVEFPLQLLQINSAAQDVTLTNVGTQLVSISGIAFTGTNAAEFSETDTCGLSLAAGATCSISITFTPTQVGARTAALTVTDSAGGSPQSIALNGFGVVPGPNATLSTNSLSITCAERCVFPLLFLCVHV
jgi:FG-GAP-like repeat